MKPITADQLAKIIHGHLVTGDGLSSLNGISIDSRTIGAGQAFFAIVGENFDGHDYAVSAIEKGASCIVVQRKIDLQSVCQTAVIRVDNCIEALAQ
ncbi:MAG: Mur ligase domain-containing protein, partial [Planctomycetota bacterium]